MDRLGSYLALKHGYRSMTPDQTIAWIFQYFIDDCLLDEKERDILPSLVSDFYHVDADDQLSSLTEQKRSRSEIADKIDELIYE